MDFDTLSECQSVCLIDYLLKANCNIPLKYIYRGLFVVAQVRYFIFSKIENSITQFCYKNERRKFVAVDAREITKRQQLDSVVS